MPSFDSLTKNELLTTPLTEQLHKAQSLTELEDIYLPYRPKRKTRGLIAREKGLLPLAEQIFASKSLSIDITNFSTRKKGRIQRRTLLLVRRILSPKMIAEDQPTRAELRQLFQKQAVIHSSVVKKNIAQGEKFRDYFDWQEPAAKAAGHRLLAMFRGENEKILKLSVRPPEESSIGSSKNAT